MSFLINGLVLLVETLIGLYVYVLLLRFILHKLRAHYYNPLIQVVIKLSDLLVKPLRSLIPNVRGYDGASLILLIILQFLAVMLMLSFDLLKLSSLWGTVLVVLGELGCKLVNIYIFAIVIQALLSWVPNASSSPAGEIVFLLSNPLLSRVRRMIPLVAGVDLSSIPVLILLYFISTNVFKPLVTYGVMQVGL